MNQPAYRFCPWLLLMMVLWGPACLKAETAKFAWLEDVGTALSIDEVKALPEHRWQSFDPANVLNLGFSDGTFWLKVSVPPELENRLLEVGYPLLDEVLVFWLRRGDVVQTHRTGDRLVFNSRPVLHRHFVFPVPSDTEAVTAYVRVKTQGSVQIPIRVVPSEQFLAEEQLSYGWQAVFLGIMVAMALYNFFVFLIVRHPTYLWYVLTVLAAAMVWLNFNGLLFQWLWPDMPILNRYVTAPIISLNIAFASLFTMSFLSLRRVSPLAFRLFQGVIALAVFTFLFGLFGSYQTSTIIVSAFGVIVTPLAWLVGLWVWRQGQILAGFYVLAWTPLLLGHLVLAVSKLGYLPSTFVTDFAPQFGVALEVILLSFALAYRINLERQRRQEAQEYALTVQRQATQMLETRVQERTEELERANEQLKAISLTDGLTQVANRRRFDERLAEEWKRASRQRHPLSLLMLDIDHFKQVNDQLGHLVGDDCLVGVASLCANEIQRSGDLLARYGGEEFSVLLPATSGQGARNVAERLRKIIAENPVYPGDGAGPVKLTVSIGVATMTPDNNTGPEALIRRADEALYQAKETGRNRVVEWLSSSVCSAPDPEKPGQSR
ncbi:diguanylate cyclase [Marinobacter sp. NP-4(2019)]|uniref:sensor domain-containing diguanylate cyclase n=1 Tax=Marinobacter sp. NP-4(2019) TaxID=2488665 RepID=UPI001D17F2ED|nr:diguanylate cyclase [Marinobacter sp. NP-4(2019)]